MRIKQNIENKKERGNKMKKITAKEYRENHNREIAYIETAFGVYEITSISEDYWAVAPGANGGRGRSFSLHAHSEILIKQPAKLNMYASKKYNPAV